MKLIIFLTLTYGNQRDNKRLGFDILNKHNFIIEQWNWTMVIAKLCQ